MIHYLLFDGRCNKGEGHSHSREHLIGQKPVQCRMSHRSPCSVFLKEIKDILTLLCDIMTDSVEPSVSKATQVTEIKDSRYEHTVQASHNTQEENEYKYKITMNVSWQSLLPLIHPFTNYNIFYAPLTFLSLYFFNHLSYLHKNKQTKCIY